MTANLDRPTWEFDGSTKVLLEERVDLNREQPPSLARRYLLLVVKLTVTLGILTLLFFRINLSEVGKILLTSRYDYLLVALGIQLSLAIISAAKLHLLLRVYGLLYPVRVIYLLNLIASFYSLFLPGTLLGGVVKWYRLSRTAGSKAQVMSGMVMDQLSHHAMILILGLLALGLAISQGIVTSRLVYAVILLLGATFLFLLVVLNKRVSEIVERVGRLALAWDPPGLLIRAVENIWSALTAYQEHKSVLVKVFGLALVYEVLTFFVGYVVARSINLGIELLQLVWILALVTIVRSIPISIAGLGVREGAFVFFFSLVGFSMEQAISYSLLGFALTVVVSLVGGLIEGWSALSSRKFYELPNLESQK